MDFNSKKTSLLILGITSLVLSRALFALFNDPEGPNLLIVVGMAVILYGLSVAVYVFNSATIGFKKLLLSIAVQVLLVAGFYLLLK